MSLELLKYSQMITNRRLVDFWEQLNVQKEKELQEAKRKVVRHLQEKWYQKVEKMLLIYINKRLRTE